jgi:hypothetical protein
VTTARPLGSRSAPDCRPDRRRRTVRAPRLLSIPLPELEPRRLVGEEERFHVADDDRRRQELLSIPERGVDGDLVYVAEI